MRHHRLRRGTSVAAWLLFASMVVVVPLAPDARAAGDLFYISADGGGNAGGVAFGDEDILTFDTTTGSWSMFFDGSDVGLGASGQEVDAFSIETDGSILLSLGTDGTLPDVGTVEDHDILRFTPTSTGDTTAGSYSMYLNGEDYELTDNGEDIDAIAFTPDGRLVISPRGYYSVSAASGGDEDLLILDSGVWQKYLDGAALGLNDSTEDTNALWIDASGDLYMAARGAFSVNGLSGDGNDIFVCSPLTPQPISDCNFSLFWDGDLNGFAGELINGFHIAGGGGPPAENPPSAVGDSAVTPIDTPAVVDVAANDSDPDGNLDPSSARTFTGPTSGSNFDNGDGTITYTPSPGYTGPDSFVYEICDTTAPTPLCDTATVSITVTAANDPPVAQDDTASTNEDTPVIVAVTGNDSDPDSNLDPASASTQTGPTSGSTTDNGDGSITYTPNGNFNGADSFTYEVCDTLGLCDTAMVSVTVDPVDDPPVAIDDNASTNADTAVTVPVAANDSDPDGNLDSSSAQTFTGPSNGSTNDNVNGTITYTPDPGFTGADSFVYEICDTTTPAPLCDTAQVDITVSGSTGGFRFAAFGDFGRGRPNDTAVADMVKAFGAEYIVTTGDNRYIADLDLAVGSNYQEYIGNYQGTYGPGAAVNRFFPSLGNHDYDEAGGVNVYLDYFTLPGAGVVTTGSSGNERYYDFIVDDLVHFFAINSESQEPDGRSSSSVQAQWLQAQLAASTTPWQVVYFHRPPYSSSTATSVMRWPFEAWGADVVLSGHMHHYERLQKGAVPFIVVGTGGAGLTGDPNNPDPDSQYFQNTELGALIVDVCADRMSFEFHGLSSGLMDSHSIGAASCSAPSLPVVSLVAGDPVAGEPADDGEFTVSRSGPVGSPLTVAYTVSGSAVGGSDYVALSGSVTIPGGQSSETILVDVIDDAVKELSETVVVTLAAGAGYNVGSPSSDMVTIADDGDVAQVSVVATDAGAGEPSNDGEFTFSRTGDATDPLTVSYLVGGSADNGTDYSMLSGSVTIPGGQSSQVLPVVVTDDLLVEGDETVVVTVIDDTTYDLGSPASDTLTITDDDGTETLEVRVGASSDDAEERPSGSVALGSSDLELIQDRSNAQTVGVRFQGVGIPQGASIVSAWIQFQTDEASSVQTDLTIRAQASDNAATFVNSSGDITSRPLTSAFALWSSVPAWSTVGEAGPLQRTPDLASVIQEVVNRPGWNSGNSLAVIISGTGSRVAESYNGSVSGAPLLHIEYSTGPVPNRPPVASDVSMSAVEETPAPVDATGNDTDPDGNLDPTTTNTVCAGCSETNFGNLVNNGDGTFTYTADPGSSANGTDSFVYEVCDFEGLCDTATVTITILSTSAPSVVEVRVANGTDDAEQRISGSMRLNSSDLEMVFANNNQQVIGIRFAGVNVPKGVTITNAWIQFQTDETSSGQTDLTIRAQASDNPATFSNTSGDVTSRPTTTSFALWAPSPWNIVGEAGSSQQTGDLSALIQEVIDRPGWQPANAIVVIITGSGSRVAEAFEGSSSAAPLLHVEYASP